jgi:uncharacterized membrane protein YecN with MAPEG domain
MKSLVGRLSHADSVMAYIPERARLLGLEFMDWLVLLVGVAVAGFLTVAL